MPDDPIAARERALDRGPSLLHLAQRRTEEYLVAGPAERGLAEPLMLKAILDALEAVSDQQRALHRDLLDEGRAEALGNLATMLARHERAPAIRRVADIVPQSFLQQIAAAVSRGEPGAAELAAAIRTMALP